MKVPRELELITDIVMAYRPKPKTKAAKRRTRRENRRKRSEENFNDSNSMLRYHSMRTSS